MRLVYHSRTAAQAWNLALVARHAPGVWAHDESELSNLSGDALVVVAAYGLAGELVGRGLSVAALSHGAVTFDETAPGEAWTNRPPQLPLEILVGTQWVADRLGERGWQARSWLPVAQPTFELAEGAAAPSAGRPLLVFLDQPGEEHDRAQAERIASDGAVAAGWAFRVWPHHGASTSDSGPLAWLKGASAVASRWSTGLIEAHLAGLKTVALGRQNHLGWSPVAESAERVYEVLVHGSEAEPADALARQVGSRPLKGSAARIAAHLKEPV